MVVTSGQTMADYLAEKMVDLMAALMVETWAVTLEQ
jgi:hypothetical protein